MIVDVVITGSHIRWLVAQVRAPLLGANLGHRVIEDEPLSRWTDDQVTRSRSQAREQLRKMLALCLLPR